MNIKKIAMIAGMAMCASTFANGLYFISGGDFRNCHIKYTVASETPNQQVEITPTKLRVMGVYSSNTKFNHPWSIKCNGEETTFLGTDCIGQGTPGNPGDPVNGTDTGATNVFPVMMEFAAPSTKMVKIYDDAYNIYNMTFNNDQAITSLYIDWRNSPVAPKATMVLNVQNCSNMNTIVFGNPPGVTKALAAYTFINMPNLVDLKITNPEQYTSIGGSSFANLGMTNDLIFVNVTNIENGAVQNLPNVHYASIPNAQSIGRQVIGNSGVNVNETKSNNLGLYKLRISDKLTSIGQNALYGHENLRTIEYVTNEEDWIGKWNSSILANVIGTAVAIEGNDNEANLNPIVGKDGVYYTGTRRIGSNTAITVKIVVIRGE